MSEREQTMQDRMKGLDLQLLEDLLKTPRGHGTAGELAIGRMLNEVYQCVEYQDDKKEALAYVRKVGESKILWSCHIDTVHADSAGIEQDIIFDLEDTMLAMADGKQPLGADNGAGVWLLLEMMKAGVPGTYVFHRGEEKGGIGSDGMAMHWDEKLIDGHTHAIAFDRRGHTDVITHQWGGRCCSEKFANQLCTLLGMGYEPSDRGSFTDTANYTTLIPECTNVSVGYNDEHGPNESLDIQHLIELREKVVEVFTEPVELVVERKVTDKDDDRWGYGGGYGYGGYRYGDPYVSFMQDFPTVYNSEKDKHNKKGKKDKQEKVYGDYDDGTLYPEALNEDDVVALPVHSVERAMRRDPEGWTDLLYKLAADLVYERSVNYDYEKGTANTPASDPDIDDESNSGYSADEARRLSDYDR